MRASWIRGFRVFGFLGLCLAAQSARAQANAADLAKLPTQPSRQEQRAQLFVRSRAIGRKPNAHAPTLSPAASLALARAEHLALLRSGSAADTLPSQGTWQPVGPFQVSTPAWNLVTGRVTSIAADPSDATGNTVYIGTTGGGVWKSVNAAGTPATASFSPLTDNLAAFANTITGVSSISMGAVSVQPGGTGVVLAGTGDPNDASDSWYGVGLLRSTDSGNNWNLISMANQAQGFGYQFFGSAFAGFAWSSASPNLVVAAVSQSLYSETIQASFPRSILGLYYSSDAGATWQMATIQDGSTVIQSSRTNILGGNAATSVVWNPIRQRFYAAIRYHGYYESADGITFTRLQHQPGANLSTDYCPSLPQGPGSPGCPIFRGALAVQTVTGDLFALTVDQNNLDQGLWQDACNVTSKACASPTVQFAKQIPDQQLDYAGTSVVPQGNYNLTLAAVPAQQDTLLFAGLTDLWRCSLAASCNWRNTTNTQTCAAAQVPSAQHAIDATFGSTGLLYFGNDSGLWRSTDAVNQQQPPCSADDAGHFQNLNAGLGSLAEVESFSEDPNNSAAFLAALGDLGTAAPSAGSAPWNQVLNGEGNVVAIDPNDTGNWYATSMFGVGINQCTEGTACNAAGFGSVIIGEPQVDNDVQIIPAPWILDPQNSANIILGTCRVWRGPASGAGWSQSSLLSGILEGGNGSSCDGNAEIRALAAGTNAQGGAQAEQLYAGMAGALDGGNLIPGHLFSAAVVDASSPSTTAWVDDYASPVTNGGFSQFNPGGFDISSIYADPHDPTGQTIYVTVQGMSVSSGQNELLYGSIDGGAHWSDLTSNLPEAPANNVLVDPNNPSIVYVALDTGVYYTLNITGCANPLNPCWNVFGDGLPNAPVTALMAFNAGATQVVRAATYGRGIWQVNLLTAGIAPTLASVTPASLTFPVQNVQTLSPAQTVTITNNGKLNLNISAVNITGDFTESDNCAGASIAPAANCAIQVTFDPSQTGTRQGAIAVLANVVGGQLNVTLSGIGVGQGDIVLTPASLTFPTTLVNATAASQSVTVANTSESVLTLNTEAVTGDFEITANTCGASLPAQTSCEVDIDFTPTASGSGTGMLTVTDMIGTQTVPLSGIGQTQATDTLSPLSLTFSPQISNTTSATQTVTVSNGGDAPLTNISASATGSFTILNNCGAELQGHGSCTILVAFAPVGTGVQSGALTVADEFHIRNVTLTGTGIAPPGMSATPQALNFGGLAAGSASSAQAVTLTNNGGVALTGLALTITQDFVISSNACPSTLAVGDSCQIAIVFTPPAAGAVAGTLTITSPVLAKPLTVALAGAGEDFSITLTGSSSAVITSGQTASFTLQLAGLSGSSGTVALACIGAPQNATCSFNPASVALSGSATSSGTLSIATGVAPSSGQSKSPVWPLAVPLLALIVPFGSLARGRRIRLGLPLLILAIALVIPLGCGVTASSGGGRGGGGGGGGGTQNQTPPGTYVITVTATMDNMAHSAAANLTVQ